MAGGTLQQARDWIRSEREGQCDGHESQMGGSACGPGGGHAEKLGRVLCQEYQDYIWVRSRLSMLSFMCGHT